MTELFTLISGQITALLNEASLLSQWEFVAVLLALAYILLAMKTSIWCWPAALLSTAIYTVLFWQVALLMESLLNVYYMGMAVYGFWLWTRGGQQHHGVELRKLSRQYHSVLIAATSVISLLLGFIMANYTQAAWPWLDAATTCFAVMATWLVAQKIVENWLYWIVIDAVSIYLYLDKGLLLTSALFVVYIGIAIGGYVSWNKRYQLGVNQNQLENNHSESFNAPIS